MRRCMACFECAANGKPIGGRALGKLSFFCCVGVGVLLALVIAGCGDGTDPSQGTVEVISGDALNPQANALARRRRIGGTTLKIRFDGDNRPNRSVPLAAVVDSFSALQGTHLIEFELYNKRGQAIAQGRQQTSVRINFVTTTELLFDPPNCEAMSEITCRTPAVATPPAVLADAEAEQCVTVNEEMSPVNGLLICVPPGVLEADTTVEVTEVYNIPSEMPDHLSQAGVIVEIRFDPEPFLSQPVTLRFPYDEQLVATGEQNLGINEAELKLFQLNNRAGQWTPLPGQPPPNIGDDTISAQSSTLGFFVVGGPRPDEGLPPVANRQIVRTFVNTSVPITLTGSDADGTPLLFRVVSSPDRGDFELTNDLMEDDVLNGVLLVPDGTALIYTPESNFFGRDAFLFEAEEISDAGLSSIVATVTILVNPRQSFMACVVAHREPGDDCIGASPVAVAVADLNSDLIPDLITANSESNDISVLLGQDGTSFSAPQTFPVGLPGANASPAALVVADFNGDGTLDLATANTVSEDVLILLGQSNAGASLNFAPQPGIGVGGAPSDMAVTDFNGDSILDLVTTNFGTSDISILIGQGGGVFNDPVEIDLSMEMEVNPRAVAVADVNGDDIPDLIIAHSDTVSILLGQPGGVFQPDQRMDFPVGQMPVSIAVGDLNDDMIPDLVTANFGSDDVSVLLGQGNVAFAHQQYPVGREPRHVVIADLNADSILDLVTANSTTDNISILLGQGDGSFLVEQGFGTGDSPFSLAVADVDRDGNSDLITADLFSHTVSGLLGNGDGTFPVPQGFGVGALPQAVDAGDLDGDGQLNPVTANAGSDYVSVLFGRSQGTLVTELQAALSAEDATDAFGPRDVVIADLENGDAILDLVTANAGVDENPSTTVSVLLGQSDMDIDAFAATSVPLDLRQGAVAVGDLNGDTIPDLVTASFGTDDEPTNLVYVLLAQGGGDYRPLSTPAIQVATGPRDIELADLDGDGFLDFVTANANSNTVSVFLGQNNGLFVSAEPRDIAVGRRPVAVAVEDLNDDGFLDLVTANTGDHNVSILLGRGDGTFAPAAPPEVAAGISPNDVAVADLESMLDAGCAPGLYIITTNASSNNVAVLRVQGEAGNVTLSAPQLFLAGNRPASVKIADFNADGRPDLIIANRDSDNVSVLLQRESENGECVFTP